MQRNIYFLEYANKYGCNCMSYYSIIELLFYGILIKLILWYAYSILSNICPFIVSPVLIGFL